MTIAPGRPHAHAGRRTDRPRHELMRMISRHSLQRLLFYALVAAWFATVYCVAPAVGRWAATYTGSNEP